MRVILPAVLSVTLGASAFAYWSAQGVGSGSASTTGGYHLTLTQTSTVSDLEPGRPPEAILGTVGIDTEAPTYIGSIIPAVTGTSSPECSADNFVVEPSALNRSITGTTANVSFGTVGFKDLSAVNQDACKNVTVYLSYSTEGETSLDTASAPRDITTVPGNAEVAVSWSPPASDGGSSIASYSVRAVDLTSSANGGQTCSSSDTSCTVTGLTNGNRYEFVVTPVNASGNGAQGTSSPATPFTTPSAPSGVTGTPGSAQVSLTWSAPGDGGSSITGYAIRYSSNGGSSWSTATTNSASSSAAYIATGLTNDTAYVFEVAARNAAGASSWSASSDPLTPSVSAGAPSAVTAVPGNGSVALSWSAPSLGSSESVSGYVVAYSSDDGSTWASTSTGTSSTNHSIDGLTNGVAYVFKVATVVNGATGPSSAPTNPVTPATTPTMGSSVSGTVGDGQIALTWSAPTSTGGSAITGYVVRSSPNGGSTWTTVTTGTTSTSYLLTGLADGTGYEVEVAATNAIGLSGWTPPTATLTPRSTGAQTSVVAPAEATNLQVQNDQLGNVSLSFSATSGPATVTATSEANPAAPTGTPFETSGATVVDLASTNLTFPVTVCMDGSESEQLYHYTGGSWVNVTSSYSAGQVCGSVTSFSPFAVATPASTPSSPTAVSGAGGNTQVTLSWNALGSNGGNAVFDYEIRASVDGGTTWSSGTDTHSSATSFDVLSLTNGTSYVFEVAAKNAAGWGSWSTQSPVVVTGSTPDAPTGIAATSNHDSAVPLSWTAPYSYGAVITDYSLRYSSNGSSWSIVDTHATTTSYNLAGLSNGTSYVIEVQATNGSGSGAWSSPTVATPSSTPDAPAAPVGVAGNDSATMSWSAPNNEGAAITDYRVRYSTNPDSGTWTTLDTSSTSLGTTLTGQRSAFESVFG